ncbi:ArsR family transcriptional regulator [Actinobaculum suis]|uniref:ArsR family transcriptional regulator n=1 Tax=Actinobaculum suis TaxID=1657 RepID=A0A7Z9C9L8_9ACTO|nr:metalloregulator ArsR/SmtB family transcription factor [Actinobaculum suis]VDG76318.1 ArsR family transcriptional regulator [Actinobaculum suis]
MADAERNKQLVEKWADIFKILGDPTRLKLLNAIHFAGDMHLTVTELAELAEVRVPTASAALRAMEKTGVVRSARSGRYIRYAIASENVHQVMHWIGLTHSEAVIPRSTSADDADVDLVETNAKGTAAQAGAE